MNQIVARQLSPDDLEPELARLVMPIARKWEAAALRVAAHHANPAKFTMPTDSDAPETILARRFDQIAKARPQLARLSGQRAADQLGLPKTERKLNAVLDTDFTKTGSVDDLAKMPKPVTKASLLRLLDRHYAQLGMQRTTTGAPFPHSHVGLDLIRVVCVDETNGLFGTERGEDEIAMSGVTLDESANAGKIEPFTVSDSFDDGDRVDFSPPKHLFTQAVGGGTSYPKHYFATLLLFEKDQGDLDETMEDILRKFADEAKEKLAAWLSVAASGFGALGAAAGAILGWLVGWLIGKIVNRLIAIWEDDPFVPRTLELIIPSASATMSGTSKVFHFTGPGEYAVRYRWSVA